MEGREVVLVGANALDLQGGTSVVLSPVGKFKSDTLDVAIDIIRNRVDTFGTGDAKKAEDFAKTFDFRPAAMIEKLGLRRPIYKQTTNYGHFGKKGLSWEE